MIKFTIPDFSDRGERNKFLVENENLIIAQKKSIIKEADGFGAAALFIGKKLEGGAEKSTPEEMLAKPVLQTKAIINTTNIIDSHSDLHIPKMWDKTLSENKNPFHLQEHSRAFKNIIASGDDVKAYVENYTWKQLGYDYEGKTQALVHDVNIRKDRNEYMHGLYAKGWVNNHSVGMQYSKLLTCINDEDYPVQKENWDKYISEAINPEKAEEQGYFWVVLEAKYIEGSAVALGSNPLTPTVETKSHPELSEEEKKTKAIKEWLLS